MWPTTVVSLVFIIYLFKLNIVFLTILSLRKNCVSVLTDTDTETDRLMKTEEWMRQTDRDADRQESQRVMER